MHYRATVTTDDTDDEQIIGLAAPDEDAAHNVLDRYFGDDDYTVDSLEERPPEEFGGEPAAVEQNAPENADAE